MAMADSNRIVFPDEVEDIKAKAAAENAKKTEDPTTIEEAPPVEPSVQMRNMIVVPSNCPDGYKMGADGVCREVFD